MKGLQTSRPVHFVDHAGEHRAGMIVYIVDASRRLVNIHVPGKLSGDPCGTAENIPFHRSTTEEPTSKPGTWHWPERIDE